MFFLKMSMTHQIAQATPIRTTDRNGLSPADPAVSEAMAQTRPLLTRQTDIWGAWVSFNFTHSLGAVLFAAFVFLLGRNETVFTQSAALAIPLSVVTSATYLALGLKYWFRVPITGCATAFACFALSAIVRLL